MNVVGKVADTVYLSSPFRFFFLPSGQSELFLCRAVTHTSLSLLLYPLFVLTVHFSHLDWKYFESGLSITYVPSIRTSGFTFFTREGLCVVVMVSSP